MKSLALALSILILPAVSNAQTAITYKGYSDLGTLLDGVAMNADPAVRTFTVGPKVQSNTKEMLQFSAMIIRVASTHANAGAITLTCTVGNSAATATSTPQVCSGAATCTHQATGIFTSATLSADADYTLRMSTAGYPVVKCVVSKSGSPAAGDLVTVTGWLVAG